MLKELRSYHNLGTPNYFFQLFTILNYNQDTIFSYSDLQKLFFNRVIDGRNVFSGCIELALKIKILMIAENKIILDVDFSNHLNNVNEMIDKFNEYLFLELKHDNEFHNIFCSKYLSYDVIYKSLQINNAAFGLKYANLKQLLIDFNVIKNHPTPNMSFFIINSEYKKLFDKAVLPEIKKRKVGIEEFHKSLELQQVYGEAAERFVLEYETKRLNNQKEIDWVAEYIVNEGYDIASYNNIKNEIPNRFIEVKSYDGDTPYFFWSRNEYIVAKRKKEEYWVYLVNRTEMHNENYQPIMKQNPYSSILNDDSWSKQVDKYKIELLNTLK